MKTCMLDCCRLARTNAKRQIIFPLSISSCLLFLYICTFALTGIVYTHKIQAEEECLSSNVLCYECDSRSDSNCADPFDFSPSANLEPAIERQHSANTSSESSTRQQTNHLDSTTQQITNETTSIIPIQRQPKKLPMLATCHGCCVKITSKTPEGGTYVKRTCTTSLQINYFMVGLVCMKESGDRGKMCFCETDYCNGQLSNHLPEAKLVIFFIALTILNLIF